MPYADAGDTGRALKHAAPLIKYGNRVFQAGHMAVIPFLARDFGPDIIRHHSAVVGEIADGKSVRFESPRARAENDTFGREEMNLRLIQAESRRSCDFFVFFDQMGQHDPFYDHDLSFPGFHTASPYFRCFAFSHLLILRFHVPKVPLFQRGIILAEFQM